MPDLYASLDVPRGADADVIRKSYLRLSKVHHPDRGGDPEKFKEIQTAYEVLTDPQKREYYDMTGSTEIGEAPPQGGFGMPDIFQMFGGMGMAGMGGIGSMFGGFGGGGPPRRQKKQKPAPKVSEIGLRIADFYHGKTITLKFDRQKFCGGCKGEGALAFQTCDTCQGRGYQEQVVQMGPGFASIHRSPCQTCSGSGRKPTRICDQCRGKKLIVGEKTLNVIIEPGMLPGETLVFANECSDDPNYVEPGDVHIVLQEADEPTQWKRTGADLHTMTQISFVESLVGCQRVLEGHPGHPDGYTLTIPAGTLHGETIVVANEGMPRKGAGAQMRGTMNIRVSISIGERERAVLVAQKDAIQAMFA